MDRSASWRLRTGVSVLATIATVAGIAIAAAVDAQAPTTGPQATTQPTAASMPAANQPGTGFGPISYFQDNCARCHGPYGSFYGGQFGNNLPPGGLRPMVKLMTEGPGGAPLDGRELDLLVAWHQSLINKTPFVILVDTDGGQSEPLVARGEVTPGATVTVRAARGEPISATVTDHLWTAQLPADANPRALKITASLNGKQATAPPSRH